MKKIGVENLDIDYSESSKKIMQFIKEQVEKADTNGVVLGLSGGVDSVTTAYLAVKALGSSKVTVLIMPYWDVTPKDDVKDALALSSALGVKHHLVDIGKIRDSYAETLPFFSEGSKIANGNLLARIRMTILYYYANKNNLCVLGTGDKSEILIGYFTKYGDGAVDLLPIGDLYKTQVRKMSLYLGVPRKIAMKPSSPRLWKGHEASKELGFTYEEIDPLLYAVFDLGLTPKKAIEATGITPEKAMAILRRVETTEHKRRMPPIPKIGRWTLGHDPYPQTLKELF